MAGTFSRFLDIFRSKANKALDKMEDPRDTLDLSYEKQLEQLQKVRRGVADVATARKRIELQAQGLQKQADKLQEQAKSALQQGNEDLAREALSRRAALGEQLAELKTQHDQISEQEQKLVQTSQELQSRVERFRTQKETLKASYTAAEAQTKVGEAVSGISDSTRNAGATMQRAQDKIASMQARAGAIDELLASGALDDLTQPVDDIQKELDKVSNTSQVDNELAALKAELGTGGDGADATAALPAAEQGGTGAGARGRLMAISRNIKPDRGLTYRMLMTGFFLVVLYAAFIGVLFALLHSLVLILVIGFGLLFCQYFFSDKIAMFAMHAQGGHARAGPAAARRGRPAVCAGRHAQATCGHRDDGHPQRVRHRPEPQEGRRLRHLRPVAPPRRAGGRGGPLARDLPRGPPRRGGHDHRQRPRHAGRPADPGDVLLGDLRRRRGGNNQSARPP